MERLPNPAPPFKVLCTSVRVFYPNIVVSRSSEEGSELGDCFSTSWRNQRL